MLKFSCEKALLTNAISIVSRTVAAKSPISVLEGIYLQAGMQLQLTGYNMETGITVTVPASVTEVGECVFPAKLLFDIVRRLPDETVTVSVDDKLHTSVVCGISVFNFSAENAQEYPEFPGTEDARRIVSIPNRNLRELLSGTTFSVSDQVVRPIHTGVLFEKSETGIVAVATDGFRLALRRWKSETPLEGEEKFVIPVAALRETEKMLNDSEDEVIISRTKLHMVIQIGDATLVCRILEGEFMDWRKVLKREQTLIMTARTNELYDSLERVGLMINEKYKSPVRCLFSKDTAEFRTDTPMGSARDCCTIAGDGRDFEIGFNCRYLLDALRVIPTEEVQMELTNNLSPIIFSPADGSESFTYLVLPVRVKTE